MHELSIQQIEMFLTVANCHSISMASKLLYISQSAVSNRIKEIEDTLDITLFSRTNRGVMLTAEGVKLYAVLDRLYNRFRIALNKAIHAQQSPGKKILRIGCLHMAEVIASMNAVCSQFRRLHPEMELTCEYYDYYELRSMLLCNELDVIFTLAFDLEPARGISYQSLFPIDAFFLLPQQWQVDAVCAENRSLMAERTMLMEPNNGYDTYHNLCMLNGFIPKRVQYVSSFLEIMDMVCCGAGFSFGGKFLPLNIQDTSKIRTILAASAENAFAFRPSIAWRQDEESPEVTKFVASSGEIDYASLPMLELLEISRPNWYTPKSRID